MSQEEAKALLAMVGLGACCGSCANGGPCEGLGAGPIRQQGIAPSAMSHRITNAPFGSQSVSQTLTRTLREEPLPGSQSAMPKYDFKAVWAVANKNIDRWDWFTKQGKILGGQDVGIAKGAKFPVSIEKKTGINSNGEPDSGDQRQRVRVLGELADYFGEWWILVQDVTLGEGAFGFGAPPHHHGGSFRRHRGGFRFRRNFAPWSFGPEIVLVEQGCSWVYQRTVEAIVKNALRAVPFQTLSDGTKWRQTFIGAWWAEHAFDGTSIYYVCVMAPPGLVGLGMEYTEHPTPGDYHIHGTGVILRAQPKYKSAAIATLQNGENVHVFGDVETDPEWVVTKNDTVEALDPDSEFAGIDYVRVGTQTHGAGWVAMLYIEPGAGTKFGQPQPQPQPQPTPAPMVKSEGMSLVSKVLLGGAIGATIAGGGYLLLKAAQGARRPAYA